MAGDKRGQRPDGGDTDLVSTPDGKGQAVPFQAGGMVGPQNNVGRGIIRVVIHGIGTGEGARRWKTNIICVNTDNSEWQNSSPLKNP
jgi:hypothetical protein